MTAIAIPQWMIIETHITQKVSPATCSELPSISLHELAIVYKEIILSITLDIFCEFPLESWKPETKIEERKLVKTLKTRIITEPYKILIPIIK